MKSVLSILLLSLCASGQTPCAGGDPPHNAPDCVPTTGWATSNFLTYTTAPYNIASWQRIDDPYFRIHLLPIQLDLWIEAQHEEWEQACHQIHGNLWGGRWRIPNSGAMFSSEAKCENYRLNPVPLQADTRKSHAVATVPRPSPKPAKPMKNADGDTCWLQTNGTAEGNHATYDCFLDKKK